MSSRYSRRTRRDRLSINVIPEQAHDAEPQSPYLHWLFGESSEVDIYTRLVDNDPDDVDDGSGYRNADATIMEEVVAWLELCEHDEFWLSKRNHAGKVRLLILVVCHTIADHRSRSFLPPANSLPA